MNRESLYRKTVDILLDAYNNGTLISGNCYACAVGNIIAANMGMKITRTRVGAFNDLHWEGYPPYGSAWNRDSLKNWIVAIYCGCVYKERIVGEIKDQIESTGYTAEELADIENNFEHPHLVIRESGENLYLRRLKAVLTTLKQIHSVEQVIAEESVERLEKVHKKLQLCE